MASTCSIVPSAQRPAHFSTGSATPKVPSSNTGPKSTLARPIIDYCTASLPEGALKRAGHRRFDELAWWLFGFRGKVAIGPLLERSWLFCNHSATMVDLDGEIVGKIGVHEDGRVIVSVTGKGCAYVPSWPAVEARLRRCGAHLTRVDIAVDDLEGQAFSVETFRQMYHQGEFNTGGRNPKSRFVSDEGSGDGNTLYIGRKGHKELCVYEKGKQLKDPESKHVRCELRLWRNKLDLPLEALSNPGKYFGAAYKMLAAFVVGEVERMQVRERYVNATAKAMVACLKNQSGTSLGLIFDALGDEAAEFIVSHIKREGRPARFKAIPGDLKTIIRQQLTQGRDHHHGQDHDSRSARFHHP